MSDADSILDVQSVSWTAGGRTILSDVSWRVDAGDHWAMLGPNGAGKTTLLRLACGYIWPNAGGRVLRLGRERLDLRDFRQRVGWVSTTLIEQMPRHQSVLGTVLAGRFAQTRLWQWDDHVLGAPDAQLARALLSEIGCGSLADQEFGTCSQGEKQRVMIARARMLDPILIILDEPCAGLDAGGRESLLTSIQQLGDRADGVSIIFVTHHVEEIMPAFRRTIVLGNGRVVTTGATESVLTETLFSDLYGLDVELVRRSGRCWAIGR